jgi:hypothetical protein
MKEASPPLIKFWQKTSVTKDEQTVVRLLRAKTIRWYKRKSLARKTK